MTISIIAAIGNNGVIGKNNKMPWDLPADWQYFKEKTLQKTLVLGLKTFQLIGGKPLPNRKHIILSDNPNYKVPEHCSLANSIDDVFDKIKNEDEVMICGGAMVYKQFLPLAHRLYLTYIHESFEGDIFFPKFDMKNWQEISRKDYGPNKENKYSYSFVVLDRKY